MRLSPKPNGSSTKTSANRGMAGMRAPMLGYEAMSESDPYKRLAAGVVTNALLEFKKICAGYKLASKERKKVDRIRLQSIQQELCEDKNIFVNLLETHGHTIDSPKLKRILKNFKNQYRVP